MSRLTPATIASAKAIVEAIKLTNEPNPAETLAALSAVLLLVGKDYGLPPMGIALTVMAVAKSADEGLAELADAGVSL